VKYSIYASFSKAFPVEDKIRSEGNQGYLDKLGRLLFYTQNYINKSHLMQEKINGYMSFNALNSRTAEFRKLAFIKSARY